MTEAIEQPFRPREKLIERQKLFQSIHKHTYLKGPLDKVTSVAIPIALAASSLYLIVSFPLSNAVEDFLPYFEECDITCTVFVITYNVCLTLVSCRDGGSITCHMELGRKNEVIVSLHVNFEEFLCSGSFLILLLKYLCLIIA